jgi:uncharacterized protein YneF (UPF0154 family)
MHNPNQQQTDVHVDELIDEVADDPSLNSHEQHFMRSQRGRKHSDRRAVRKILKIYVKSSQER